MKIIRLVLSILLLAACVYMVYSLWLTIKEPIEFEAQRTIRDDDTVVKLKDIRLAQIAHRTRKGTYAASFDSLLYFLKNDSLEFVKQIGDPNDTTVVAETVVTYKLVKDSLFKNDMQKINNLPNVPHGTPGAKFNIDAGVITKNDIEIPVFEVGVPYPTLYEGLIPKYFQNKAEKSLSVGSMTEGTTSGNWEN